MADRYLERIRAQHLLQPSHRRTLKRDLQSGWPVSMPVSGLRGERMPVSDLLVSCLLVSDLRCERMPVCDLLVRDLRCERMPVSDLPR